VSKAYDWNGKIIAEFRANHGKVGGMFEGSTLLLLTTTGAKTGVRRTNPLAYMPDGDRVLVCASAAGSPTNPDWLHNLVADPELAPTATPTAGPTQHTAPIAPPSSPANTGWRSPSIRLSTVSLDRTRVGSSGCVILVQVGADGTRYGAAGRSARTPWLRVGSHRGRRPGAKRARAHERAPR